MDKRLDILSTSKSPGVREAICIVGSEKSFGASQKLLKALSEITVSKDRIRIIAENVGNAIEKQNQTAQDTYYWENRKSEISPASIKPSKQMYVGADGTCINTLEGWKEIKIGAVFDAKPGKRKPLRGTTTYVGGFEDSKAFMRRLYVQAYLRGIDMADKQIAIGDAAKWIWNEFDFHFPKAKQIVDYYHATERPWDIAKAIFLNDNNKTHAFVKPYINNLKAGRIDSIINNLKNVKSPSKEITNKIGDAITYYQNNKSKMNYRKFKREGFFIGSGVIEAGCKVNVGQRLKGCGMRWSIPGANSILQLRNCFLNDNWNNFKRDFYYNC